MVKEGDLESSEDRSEDSAGEEAFLFGEKTMSASSSLKIPDSEYLTGGPELRFGRETAIVSLSLEDGRGKFGSRTVSLILFFGGMASAAPSSMALSMEIAGDGEGEIASASLRVPMGGMPMPRSVASTYLWRLMLDIFLLQWNTITRAESAALEGGGMAYSRKTVEFRRARPAGIHSHVDKEAVVDLGK